MEHIRRSIFVKGAASLGLGVLLCAAVGRSAGATDQLLGSRPAVEPTADESFGPPPTEGTAASQTPESVVRNWPEGSRVTARAMIVKYGAPSMFSERSLVWFDNGPWHKTVVYRDARSHYLGRADKDYLEQTVIYKVPSDKVADLRRFDRRVAADTERGRLSSLGSSEAMNYLALNLADEIITGKRSVEDARDFLRKSETLSMAGKSSQYTDGLLFPAQTEADSTHLDSTPVTHPSVDESPIDTDYDKNLTP